MLGTGLDELCFPTGLASSPDGNVLYVADRSTCRLLKLSATSGELLASSLHGELQNPDGVAKVGELLYVADANNHRVACFTTDLELRFAFGSSWPRRLVRGGATTAVRQRRGGVCALGGWMLSRS